MYLRLINIFMTIPTVTKTPASKFCDFKDTIESSKMKLITLIIYGYVVLTMLLLKITPFSNTLLVLIYRKSYVDISVPGISPKCSHNMLLKVNG